VGKQRLSIIPAAAVADAELNHTCLRVLAQIGTYTDDNGWCFPRQKEIGAVLGLQRAAVNRAIQRLAARGYLEVHSRKRNDGGTAANFYRVILDTPVVPAVENEQVQVDAETQNEGTPVSAAIQGGCIASDTGPDSADDTGPDSSADTPPESAGATAVTTHLNDPIQKELRAWTNATEPPVPSALRSALQRLCGEVGKATAGSWLNDLVIVSLDPPVLRARTRFISNHIRSHFLARLEDMLGKRIKIEIEKPGARRAGGKTGGAGQ
tara:strand:- start:5318 stop:6115 length:798 start_codon:yes stop_codon:yes gene_type:complete